MEYEYLRAEVSRRLVDRLEVRSHQVDRQVQGEVASLSTSLM